MNEREIIETETHMVQAEVIAAICKYQDQHNLTDRRLYGLLWDRGRIPKDYLRGVFEGNSFFTLRELGKLQHCLDVKIQVKFLDRQKIRDKNKII